VTLDGSSSGGDAPLTCLWSIETQGGTVLDTKTGCTVSYTFAQAGTQYVKLSVTDADGDSNSSRKSFAVGTTPPPPPPPDSPASAVWTAPVDATAGVPVTLDGSSSGGDPQLSCVWSFEDQSGATVWETRPGCEIPFTFQNADTKYVKLTVTDANGDVDSNRQSFAVASASSPSPPPDNPASAVWIAPADATVGVPVTLDGSSSGGDGPLTCAWSFETQDGTVLGRQAGCTVSHTFAQAGTQYVKLSVTDADGDRSSSRKSFAVAAPASPPSPPSEPVSSPVRPHAIWSLPAEIDPGQTLVLDGTASTGEPPLTCTWTVADRSGSRVWQRQTGCKFTYRAPRFGTQYVRLTVRDVNGAGDSLRRAVTVRNVSRYARTSIAIKRAAVQRRRAAR
jgi:PKD repeat protein